MMSQMSAEGPHVTNAVSTSPKSPGFDTLLSKLEPELVECGDLRVKWFKWSFVLAGLIIRS